MKSALFILLLLLVGCSTGPTPEPEHPSGLKITEINPSHDSFIMKQNVLHLAQVYDLSPFLYTKRIQIKTDAISQSHPVLTLNIRYTNYPHKILAQFLHEEFHWWALMKKTEMTSATVELKKYFPGKRLNDYIHLLICYVEYESLKHYLGNKAAYQVLREFIYKEKLRSWHYSQVLVNGKTLKKIFLKYKLVPSPLA